MERIEQSTLLIPTAWLATILTEHQGKAKSHIFKKILDGFFEPQEMAARKASKMMEDFPDIMGPLRRK
tara:strand:+ start:420 stop:623 length:204 start_codon:yes stop_codon:yes gene_type:complete